MSYYDQLPNHVKNIINHFIPYKNDPPNFLFEYKIFLQDWKNQCNSKKWNGLEEDLNYDSHEIPFLQNAYFKHQIIKKYYNINYSLEKGISWKRNNYRRNTI
jgi:hypothetical protein|tara:strand:+ start:180 stop:485 length:306 start_codon:yes stop_codon:yes gene_type:complete